MIKRGTYAKDLTKELKIRINENTFKQITALSEEQEINKSFMIRQIIDNVITKK